MKKSYQYAKDIGLTLLILAATFCLSIALQDVFNTWEHITTLFVFAVFLICLVTSGYVYGIVSALISVLAVNYAFTYPYFAINFSIPGNLVSAIVMLIIAILTGMLTTNLKKWQAVKAESEMERMRANLLRSVSHDLRTPLTTIYGASSSITENYEKLSDEQKLQMAKGIREDADWLIRMVENLLSVTRIDSGAVQLHKTPVVLEELIDTALLKFKKRYPRQAVEVDIPESIVMIPMDALLIEQVILNILENAVHHAKGFTRLTLRVSVTGKDAVFEIRDNGCGIPREKLDSLFTGYAGTADTQSRNAGIGLSVCATILKAHNGSIYAKNAKDGGAIFRFTLAVEDTNEQ